ncbi:hypothetical protein ACA910_020263 [Epithemia clementina (nom. ined.)]
MTYLLRFVFGLHALMLIAIPTISFQLRAAAQSHHHHHDNPNNKDLQGRTTHYAVASIETFEEIKPTQSWDVERYQRQHSFVWKYGSSLIDQLAELIGGEEDSHDVCADDQSTASDRSRSCSDYSKLRILDIGCGSGELTKELADRFPSCTVHGMDLDPEMVKTAHSQFPDLKFFQQDVRTLHHVPINNDVFGERYDIIFSNAALHWVPPDDAELAAQSLAKHLKPGGHLVVEFGGKGNVQSIVQATLSAIGEVATETNNPALLSLCRNMKPVWYFPSVGEYSSLLEKYGIEVTSATLFDRPTPLEDGDSGMSNWLKMFGSKFFEALTEKQTEKVLQKVDDKLRKSHLWNGGQWVADYRRLRLVGVKRSADWFIIASSQQRTFYHRLKKDESCFPIIH